MGFGFKPSAIYAARAILSNNRWTRGKIGELRRNEQLSPSEYDELQKRYLYRTLQSALRKYPFYEGISSQFAPRDAKVFLRENFPVIDKATLLNNKEQLYPHTGKPRIWELAGKTSGTTGTPLTVYRSFESAAMEQAFIRRHWAWAGFGPGSTRVTLRGDMVVPLTQDTPPFWRWNRFERQLLVSSRHLREPFVGHIIDEIRKIRPLALQAYPSTAYSLAQFLQQRGEVLRIPFLFSASEPLYDHQRELIAESMGCTIMDMYGMAERVAFATGCEFGRMHLNPDYSFVEIVDESGQPTEGEGFIVGTTFHNSAMPLVRYRLTDRTRIRPESCDCGRAFTVIDPVTGKYEDVVTGISGNPISPSVLTFAFKGVDNIAKSQVAQVGIGEWQIRIVPMPGFSMVDEAKLVDNIRRSVDAEVKVDIVLKDELLNTEVGKFRWIVNETGA